MSDAYERVLGLLDKVKRNGPDEAIACCPVPAHGKGRGDKNPSLTVGHHDEKVLLNCQSGCHVQDVMMALGLEWTDLFDGPITRDRGHLVARYVYTDNHGRPYHEIERWEAPDGKRFVNRLPDREFAGLPAGHLPALYHLPTVLAEAARGGTIYVVEGEKCVHAAESLGVVATTCPNGAKKWKPYFWHWLQGVGKVVVIVDNDKPGRKHGKIVRDDLTAHGIAVDTMAVRLSGVGEDLYDHVKAGYGIADLVRVDLDRERPITVGFNDLLATKFPDVKWAVPGLISTGLTLLGGAPKQGKSQVTLDLALGVASGGQAMTSLDCSQGSVLYLSLDNDSERRIKARAMYLLGHRVPDAPLPIEVHTSWPTGPAAVAACAEWAKDATNPLLVVVDTYVRVEPEFEGDGRSNSYAASVQVMNRWAQFATDYDLAVVAVHHDNKGNLDGDWMNRFMGSRGLTATAQTLLFLDAKRGEDVGVLHTAGRDIESMDVEIARQGWRWAVMGGVSQPRRFVPRVVPAG